MSVFARVTDGASPKSKNIIPISLMYSAILVIFAVAQLFTFDDFQNLIDSFWLPGGAPVAYFLSGFIVVAEVFALPFLLRMRVSPLMRYVSMFLGWFVPLFWLCISLWLQLTVNAVNNVGMVGTVAKLMPGWWAVLFSAALAILAVWISWGLWPRVTQSKK
jgi:hypothetical protein